MTDNGQDTIVEYLAKSGQTFQYLISGASQYGISFIEELATKALKENKIIIWKPCLTEGEDIGMLEYELKDADILKGICKEAIVANVIDEHYWGANKEIKKGTKHFRPGAKVYCVFMYGGLAHENVRVLGKPRKSFRLVDIVIRREYLKNFRVQKVYSRQVMAFLGKYPSHTNIEIIRSGVDQLNKERNAEIKSDHRL